MYIGYRYVEQGRAEFPVGVLRVFLFYVELRGTAILVTEIKLVYKFKIIRIHVTLPE
ncbi:hypothetical protein GCM10010917_39990 [Paenibacillus physcomitrellae]|uniref:Uncharacterized protein n=1 Tax=Paenibacillus physcomitrellae TaxID=1619311 RepID=A0ABQ1GVD4_9BACL|nr:hypothetical protein GCM10010917_39990 [Paenibacillus physcomitrellae]